MISARQHGGVITYHRLEAEHVVGPGGSILWVECFNNIPLPLPRFSYIGEWLLVHLCCDQPYPESPNVARNPRLEVRSPGFSPNAWASRVISAWTTEWNSTSPIPGIQNNREHIWNGDHSFDDDFGEPPGGSRYTSTNGRWVARGPRGFFCSGVSTGMIFRMEVKWIGSTPPDWHFVQGNLCVGSNIDEAANDEGNAARTQVKGTAYKHEPISLDGCRVLFDPLPGQLIGLRSWPDMGMLYQASGHIL